MGNYESEGGEEGKEGEMWRGERDERSCCASDECALQFA